MAFGVQVWSQTAASNSNSDTAINFAEGMAPSAVNDSARALMASVAKWRDDINGSITTTGTSTAYAVTSNQIEAALTANYVIAFVPHTTNAATVTLDVDGLGAKPLRSAPGVELPAGVIVEGAPYAATYKTSNSGEWILQGFHGNPYNIPIGGMIPYTGTTAPNSSFVLPYGQAISRTTYSTLFALTSTSFGPGDGSTTFNVPDLRGRIPVGKDDMGGTAASRVTSSGSSIDGTTMGKTGGAETKVIVTDNLPPYTPAGTLALSATAHILMSEAGQVSSGQSGRSVQETNTAVIFDSLTGTFTGTPQGGTSTPVVIMPPSIIVPWILRVI